MSRLIDADAIPYTMLYKEDWLKGTGVEKQGVWKDTIDAMPTIEPERKTGKWIERDDGWDGVYYECSVCKEPFTLIDGTPSENLYNFCPNCGADMRGDQNED